MYWLSRIVNVMRRDRVDDDLEEEIRFHLAARTEDLIREGVAAGDAAQRARVQFGNPVTLRESSRDVKLMPWLESVLRDVGFGLRVLRRNKTVSAAAIVSLSLAIGACTAAFSLIDALILRPLPVDDPDSLSYVALRAPGDARDNLSFNYPLFVRMREAGRSRIRLFAVSDQGRRDAIFDDRGFSEKVYGQWISGDTFSILGVKPALGRLLASSDDVQPDQHPVAVLSYDFWTRRFASDPQVLGRWVTIRGKPLQIVGVAEQRFTGVEPGIMTDLWAPAMMWDRRAITDSGTRWFRMWGRNEPGVAAEQVVPVLQTIFTEFIREEIGSRPVDAADRTQRLINTRVYLRSSATGSSGVREDFARALWILGCIAGLVLLIACSNVACLLLARTTAREREMALRVAIGAGHGRLIQQVLIEGALLSVVSCAVGALFARIVAPRVATLLSTSRSIVRLDLEMDWRVLLFLGVVASLVTFIFGLAPALRASAVSPNDALQAASGRHTQKVGLFKPLVVAQTAFAFVVLFVAGLCLLSFAKLARIDLGFDPDDLAVVAFQTDGTPEEDQSDDVSRELRNVSIWEQLQQRVEQSPGIESASLSRVSLFVGAGRNKSVRIPGRPLDDDDPWYLQISPGFLRTMKIPLLEGRDLEWRDSRRQPPSAVIVNQSFAGRYFPGESAVGKRFFRVDGGAVLVPQEIVGVAADAKYTSLRDAAPPTVYDAYGQEPFAVLQMRTRLEEGALAAILREQLPRAHPALRLGDVTLQSTLVANNMVRDRALALLSGFFSMVAIVLVAVGLYGVLSYTVLQRTREIGIHMTFGARPLRIVALMVSEMTVVAAIGLIVGVAGGLAAARFISALLYDVEPTSASTMGAAVVCLIAVCAVAAAIPAWRATRVNPTQALRWE
jgi:predicted permease